MIIYESLLCTTICLYIFFRLGRYPIHFHLNGNMNQSYVKGCSIYRAFNRAVNIHNTHNVLIQDNVVFDVRGGAMFTEDSIETG